MPGGVGSFACESLFTLIFVAISNTGKKLYLLLSVAVGRPFEVQRSRGGAKAESPEVP